ncbi:MAG: tetratricopeptide repeat protein, partial [Pseudomonadota bacterium]
MTRAGKFKAGFFIIAAALFCSGCATSQTTASVRSLKPSEAEELLALQAARQKPAEGEPVLDPARIEAHADGLALRGEWSTALFQYGRALGLAAEADKSRLRAKLGESSLKAAMFVPAEGFFAELVQAKAADASAWQGLGLARFGQGKLEPAAADLIKAVALDARLWRAHNALGIIANRQGRPDAAVVSFRAAIRLRPELPALYNNLGLAYMLKNDWTQAEASLRQALRLQPDYALAANNLGLVLARQGRTADALRAFEAAEGQARAHHNLGVVMAWQGDLARAADQFRQAVNSMPRYYPLADRHLDQVEEMLGRRPDLAGAAGGSEAPAAKVAYQPAGGWPVVERGQPREEPRSPAPLIPRKSPDWSATTTPAASEAPRLAPGPKP